ncbi:MAG: GumC family protein [Pseudomonadota bacterium]
MNQGQLINVNPSHREKNVGDEIRELILLLFRKLPIVFGTAFTVMALILIYIWVTTPLFSSTVQLLIDPRQRQTVENEVTPTGLGTSATGADNWLMESQVEIINSSQVIDKLIDAESLTTDPEFGGTGSGSDSILSFAKNAVKTIVYGPQSSHWNERSPYDKVLRKLSKRMNVERLRNTYVISVTFRSKDPQKAARLANTAADIYINTTINAVSASTLEAANSLGSKLQQLRAAASSSAQAVEEYRQENGLIDTNSTLLIEQRLSELNSELSNARAATNSALARKNQVEAALQSGAELTGGSSQIAESTVLNSLQTQLAELNSAEAELALVYLPQHPRLVGIAGRKEALNASIQREYRRVLKRLDADFQTEKQRADALEQELQRLEQEMAASNSSTVKLRELELEANASRTIYESFLRRSKEAQEQVDIPRGTTRIISVARPASKPSDPNVPLLLVAGLALGGLLGIVFALVSSIFGKQPIASTDNSYVRYQFDHDSSDTPTKVATVKPVGSPLAAAALRAAHEEISNRPNGRPGSTKH